MVKWIIGAILLLPIAEIGVFILLAALLGLGWALALLLATTFLGIWVLRRAGRRQIAGFRVAVGDRDTTGIEANTGSFLTVLGGILLLLPGFITDVVGLLLLIPFVQRWCAARLHAAIHGGERRNAVIDLAPGEWTQIPDRELERDRGPKRRP